MHSHPLPTDRIVYFSDAIFAIAITLLILEIKVPAAADMETYGTVGVLRKAIPSFIGFVVSFFVTALYWRAHLIQARLIKNFTPALLWLNILLLFFVVLLPFSTAFYSKYFSYNGAFFFYCANMVLIGTFNFWMLKSILRQNAGELTREYVRWMQLRALVAPIVWGLSIAVALVSPLTSRFFFAVIFPVLAILDWRYRRTAESA